MLHLKRTLKTTTTPGPSMKPTVYRTATTKNTSQTVQVPTKTNVVDPNRKSSSSNVKSPNPTGPVSKQNESQSNPATRTTGTLGFPYFLYFYLILNCFPFDNRFRTVQVEWKGNESFSGQRSESYFFCSCSSSAAVTGGRTRIGCQRQFDKSILYSNLWSSSGKRSEPIGVFGRYAIHCCF